MRRAFWATLFVLPILHVAPADAGCYGTQRVQAQLPFDFRDHEDRPIRPDLCNENSTGYRTITLLFFLRALRDLKVAPSEFNPNIITTSPFRFFSDRVRKIVIDERAGSENCSDGRLAYVSPFDTEEKKIWICPNIKFVDEVVGGSVLIHESRHLDGPMYAHAQCLRGILKDQMSCDESFEAGGAYGVGLEFLVKLVRHPDTNPRIRALARRAAVMDFVTRFNRPPLDIQVGALLRSKRGFSFYDGERETPLLFPDLPADAIVTLQGGLPLFFSPSRKSARLYAFGSHLENPLQDVLTDHYETAAMNEKRGELLDVSYGSSTACFLLQSSLECFGRDQVPVSIPLQGVKPAKLLHTPYSRIVESGTLHLIDANGFAHRLPPEAEQLKSQPIESWTTSAQPFAFVAGGPWPGGEIWLDRGGQVTLLNYRQKRFDAAPGTQGPYTQLISPFVWSTKLREL